MTIIAFRSVIHESTLNNKLAAVPTLWSISPPPPPPPPPKMLISTFSVCEEVVISMHACIHACMYVQISVRWWLTVVCVCVLCMCMCMWFGRLVLQGGAVYIASGGQGTFTNCNFTSNEAQVSLEEEHVDDCEMSECMTLRLCPPYIHS